MWSRLRSFAETLFRPRRLGEELDHELRFHIESRADDLERQGLLREAALRQARIELGAMPAIVDDVRRARGARFADELRQDLRFALRGFHRSPSFPAIVIATLALGIGASTAMFSVVNAVLLRPVEAPDPDRVVVFGTARQGLPPSGGSPTRFNAWRDLDDVFQDVSAYVYARMNLTGPGSPRQVHVAQVSEGYFRLFGLVPAQGRTFTPQEDLPNAGRFAVVSAALAKEIFDSETPLGRRILLGEEPHTIVGVMPPGVRVESRRPIDAWIPLQIGKESLDQSHFFAVAGRIRPGVTASQIETSLAVASEAFAHEFPEIGARLGGTRFVVRPIQEVVGGSARPALLTLLGAVSCLLLIACANVAGLLLARATAREREIALRAGLGATRARLIRQLLVETSVLWFLGAALSLPAGLAGVRFLLSLEPGSLPRIGEGAVPVDWRVLAFTAAVSLLTGLLFAVYPAVRGSRAGLRASLQSDRSRARSFLVAGQIALALALVIASGLLIRTFFAMRAVDPGFDARNVLTMQALLEDQRYRDTAGLDDLVARSVRAIEAIPGVDSAAAGCCPPIGGQPNASFSIVGALDGAAEWPRANIPTVSQEFFTVHRIPLLRGRTFTSADNQKSRRVVVISQSLAQRYWPAGGAVGSQITIGAGGVERHEIVGIVGDVRDRSDDIPARTIYTPLAQSPDNATAYNVRRPTFWMVRTAGDASAVRDAVRAAIEQASGLPVIEVQSMEQIVAHSTAEPDFRLSLMLAFGIVAMTLATVGVYGLVSYEIAQRRNEVGVRLALGARGQDIRRLIAARTAKLAACGLAAGLVVAFAVSGLLARFLFGVEPRDPLVFALAPLLLCGVALAAAAFPAVRASRLNPVAALRHE